MTRKNSVATVADRIHGAATVIATVGRIAGVVAGAAGAVSGVATAVEDAGTSVNNSVVQPAKRALGLKKRASTKDTSTKQSVKPKASRKTRQKK